MPILLSQFVVKPVLAAMAFANVLLLVGAGFHLGLLSI
jgi:hypothetical protein